MRAIRPLLLIVVSAAVLSADAPPQPDQAPTRYLLRPQRVLDVEAGVLREGQAVMVLGDRIESVGSASTMTVPAGTEMIDLPRTTLLPGLMDLHSHVPSIRTTKRRGTTRS